MGTDVEPIEERLPGSRAKFWLLLHANRRHLAAVLLVGGFAVLLGLSRLQLALLPVEEATTALFQSLVVAVITSVSLVVTFNQLVLSQELGPAGDQRQRVADSLDFRQEVQDAIGTDVTSPDPGPFLGALVRAAAEQAETIEKQCDSIPDEALASELQEYTREIRGNALRTSPQLDEGEFGTFDVIGASLDFNYSRKLYETRRFQQVYEDDLSPESAQALDQLGDILELYGSAREHFKTLYFQWELIDMSRSLLYATLPSLGISISMLLFLYNPATLPGSTLGFDNYVIVVSGAVTVALLPFYLLLAYVLRIVTVAKRTLAAGPFVLRRADFPEYLEQ